MHSKYFKKGITQTYAAAQKRRQELTDETFKRVAGAEVPKLLLSEVEAKSVVARILAGDETVWDEWYSFFDHS